MCWRHMNSGGQFWPMCQKARPPARLAHGPFGTGLEGDSYVGRDLPLFQHTLAVRLVAPPVVTTAGNCSCEHKTGALADVSLRRDFSWGNPLNSLVPGDGGI